LNARGLAVYALPKTAAALSHVAGVREVREEDGTAETALRSGSIDVVFSGSGGAGTSRDRSSLTLARLAIGLGVPVVGDAVLSRGVIRALASTPLESLKAKPWRHYLTRASTRGGRASLAPSAGSEVGAAAVRVFVRQPFTQTHARERAVVRGVLNVLRQLD